MPRKTKRQKARIATEPPKKVRLKPMEEAPAFPAYTPLVMEERDRLTAILNDPVFRKAWKNIEAMKPSVFPRSNDRFEGEHGQQAASNVLHVLQGWELHKAALIKQSLEVAPKKPASNEEYPDAGRLEAEVARTIKK